MMFKHFAVIIIALLLVSVEMRGQYDAAFAHYWAMETSFNPAAVGKETKLNVTAAYAIDMAGFENNPNTMYAAADMPFVFLKGVHGAGVQFMNDKLGLFSHQKLGLQYAPKFKLFGGTASVGVQIGMLSEKFDGSGLDLGDSNDPAFTTSEVNGNALDIGAGIYYVHGDWYGGLFYQQLRNPFLSIKPSLLVRTDTKVYRADISGRLVYKTDEKLMYAGLGYSPSTSVTFMVGGSFHGFVLGYSYEVYTSAISAANGSHELFLGYQHDINLIKKGKNKHKSVRIL